MRIPMRLRFTAGWELTMSAKRHLGSRAFLSWRADAKPQGPLSLHRPSDAGYLSGMAQGSAGPRLSLRLCARSWARSPDAPQDQCGRDESPDRWQARLDAGT